MYSWWVVTNYVGVVSIEKTFLTLEIFEFTSALHIYSL